MSRGVPGRRWRAYSRGPAHEGEESQLSEENAAATGSGTDGAVLLFVGGPLDGRVQIREARHGDPLPTVTHVHLHGGPKVVHRYDLQVVGEQAGIYHLRPPAQRLTHEDRLAD
ncbi:hypothetical protein BD833_1136 [Blastococcus xanthinilyticus]|uniref:Uncharacterized protein n=1 Tax=Blastococcus xanthinilyticus TaxID=1564164 RepID=A0A5S5CPQ0_9ACTN|nr:hypothetical protein BD833_1136 [Blastococcus xanthinilyticus]